MTDLLPWPHICSYCDLGHPCVRDETRGAREKHFVISDDEKEEVSVIISRVTGVKAETDTVLGMDEKEGVGGWHRSC